MPWTEAIRRFSYLALALQSGLMVANGSAQQPEPDYDVRISILKSCDGDERTLNEQSWRFVTVKPSDGVNSVEDVLMARHICADADALGLIYAANPDLRDARALKAGETIRVPEIEAIPEAQHAISDGYAFKIYYDDRIIRELISLRRNLAEALENISKATPDALARSGFDRATLKCTASIRDDFGQIADHLEDRDQPTNHEILTQLRGEVKFVRGALSRADAVISAADQIRICAVAKDLTLKQASFNSERGPAATFQRPPMVLVRVNTYTEAAPHKLADMLRVHYAPEALQNDPSEVRPFPGLSSPTESQVPEADYVFWVTRDGDPSLLSKRVLLSVRRTESSQPLILDILVKQ
jgi:hypothetical protein